MCIKEKMWCALGMFHREIQPNVLSLYSWSLASIEGLISGGWVMNHPDLRGLGLFVSFRLFKVPPSYGNGFENSQNIHYGLTAFSYCTYWSLGGKTSWMLENKFFAMSFSLCRWFNTQRCWGISASLAFLLEVGEEAACSVRWRCPVVRKWWDSQGEDVLSILRTLLLFSREFSPVKIGKRPLLIFLIWL